MHIYYSGIGATKSKMTLDEFILFVKMNRGEKETIQYIYENQKIFHERQKFISEKASYFRCLKSSI